MDFSEYAQGISPFCSFGKSEQDFFTELIGNFIKDAAMDSCKILKRNEYILAVKAVLQEYDVSNLQTLIARINEQINQSVGENGHE